MKKNKTSFIISLVIIFFISLISIAYSAFTQNLAINDISSNVRITKEILIKIKYKDNMYNSGNIDNNFVLNFDFDQIYNVNITGLDSLVEYPTTVINGDNYVIEVGPNYNINVNIDGTSTNPYKIKY